MTNFFSKPNQERLKERKELQKAKKTAEQEKILQAIKEKRFSFVLRDYEKQTVENSSRQSFVLFLTITHEDGRVQTLGNLKFNVYENVDLEDVFVASKEKKRKIEGHENKLVHLDMVFLFENYRKLGLSKLLISHFVELYQKHYTDFSFSVEFIDPLVEYGFQKICKEKGLQTLLNEKLIQRFYLLSTKGEPDDKTLINVFKEQDSDLFPFEIDYYFKNK